MRSKTSFGVFSCLLGLSLLSGLFVEPAVSQCTDRGYSPTYGKPATKFVSGCEIYLFGEYLEPVEGPDGTMGFLIEKTDSAVTLNGRHYYSPYDPPRKIVKAISEEIKHRAAVKNEAQKEIRRLAVAHPTIEGAYNLGGILYGDELQPYITKSGDTVMVKFYKDEVEVVYENTPLIFKLVPDPVRPKEEQDAFRLDNIYLSLVDAIKPERIILIGRGYELSYPLSEAPAVKDALKKVPALARPIFQDIYGKWAYDAMTIDGYFFHSGVISDFTDR